ncbi:hypothetical protein CDV36_000746 [Fusarium kuroshium]|uniref:ARS-binding protein 2 n=1 Tax=Fusarium kuroshium TaxID=2010991 RepID=A0A3M2SPY8_9HYPO|nr:hypothetical protein CDV36_000746 [Fusarium kuroshium]
MPSPNNPPPPPPLSQPAASQPGPSAPGSVATPDIPVRPELPDRRVTADTIEDAYVRFMLYCNPGISPSTPTITLREAFRNPPRSGGKTFSTFAVYELVRKFYDNEIRTWTELTTRLGVEPPDPSKEESAQKIAQYGVRLKKWMNSMHVKAFFEYLMDIPNDYWTKIPADTNPTSQPMRDGVALEDDMALRALLPQIRPRRGRKRPAEDEVVTSPAQRSFLAPPSATDDLRTGITSVLSAGPGSAPWSEGVQQMPLFRWPQSAVTPTTRNSFWDDALEPQSGVTPSKPKAGTQRRGAKNVSSAWRPGVASGGVKPRGRPPMNRTPIETSLPPFSSSTPTPPLGEHNVPAYTQSIPVSAAPAIDGAPQYSVPTSAAPYSQQPPAAERPPRPNISLQVPDRPPGSVRLATPPPAVVINGEPSNHPPAPDPTQQTPRATNFTKAANEAVGQGKPQAEVPGPKNLPRYYFERGEDRTNVDRVIAYMTHGCLAAEFFDAEGRPSYGCTMKEALGITNSTIEEMYKAATSPEAFLINLAAVTGGSHLVTARTRICRLGRENGAMRYSCEWTYGFGHLRGVYQMEQKVPLDLIEERPRRDDGPMGTAEGTASSLSVSEWQAKYESLLGEVQKKDERLWDLRAKVADLLKGDSEKV